MKLIKDIGVAGCFKGGICRAPTHIMAVPFPLLCIIIKTSYPCVYLINCANFTTTNTIIKIFHC
uniref:Uncharacterized protein n=1 Tax=Rhizophagus irregularis (strain DAOM 181602 / DAOM 197198 / MUCL 43194) TaxID=747089 RepID=U9SSI8_RHIID